MLIIDVMELQMALANEAPGNIVRQGTVLSSGLRRRVKGKVSSVPN
jgi:hypothetical protein